MSFEDFPGPGRLYLGDCLQIMPTIPDNVADMILCDLPYGTTACKWDTVIPFELLWEQWWRICKPDAVVALTASQPFTSALVMSQVKFFRHEWIWIKDKAGNFANAKREPMKEHESIVVFAQNRWTYNKQLQTRTGNHGGRANTSGGFCSDNYRHDGKERHRTVMPELRVPSSHQKFNTERGLHPTQKPISLFEYFIRTYTNPGQLVFDCCIGSGTTAIACLNNERRWVGIEQDEEYYAKAAERIRMHKVSD